MSIVCTLASALASPLFLIDTPKLLNMKLRLNFFVIFFFFYSQKWPSSASTVQCQTTFVCLSAQIKVNYQRASIVCSDEAAVSVTDTLWFSAVVQFSTRWEHSKKNLCAFCSDFHWFFTVFNGVNNEVTRSVKGTERGEKRGIEEVAPPTLILLLHHTANTDLVHCVLWSEVKKEESVH